MAMYNGYGRMREDGLPDIGASAAVPAGYGAPTFGMGDAAPGGLNPDQTLLADSVPSDLVDPNTGFSIGGADDPLAEGFDDGVALGEDGLSIDDIPVDDGYPVMEGDDMGYPVMEDGDFDPASADGIQYEGLEDLPPFDEDEDNPDLDGLPIDEDGIIDPMVIPSEIEENDPALGTMPEAELPMEEPIVQVESDDVDVCYAIDGLGARVAGDHEHEVMATGGG